MKLTLEVTLHVDVEGWQTEYGLTSKSAATADAAQVIASAITEGAFANAIGGAWPALRDLSTVSVWVTDVTVDPDLRPDRPMPGDAVVLGTPWMTANAGAVGVIGGMLGVPEDEVHITFNPRTYRDDKVVRVSGGPGSMFTPAGELEWVGVRTITVWRFRNDIHRAHNDVDYEVTVPLWRWSPLPN